MRIFALEPAPDSKLLVPTLLRALKPHTTPVISASTDRSGTLLATGGADGVVKVWDIRGGYVTHTLRGHTGVISSLSFFEVPTEHKIQTANGKARNRAGSAHEPSKAAGDEAPSGFRLASGDEDGKIRVWDLVKRKSIAILDSHVSVVRSLDYSIHLGALVSASRDKTLIIWDAKSWKTRRVLPVLESIEAVGVLDGGNAIFSGGEHGKIRLWSPADGRELTKEQRPGAEGDAILAVLYRAATNSLISIHNDQSLVLHGLAPLSGDDLGSSTIQPLPILRRVSGSLDEVIDMAYVSQNGSLLALATNLEYVKLVNVAPDSASTGTTSREFFGSDAGILEGHEEIIISLDVDWSGCWLATGAKDNTARLWRIDQANKAYTCFATFVGHAESLGAVALPKKSPPLVSAAHTDPLSHPPTFLLTGSQDKTIKCWEIAKSAKATSHHRISRAVYTRKAHDKELNAITINHDSTLFASASQDRTVRIWSVQEGEAQGVLRGHKRGVWSVAFAPAGTPAIMGESGPVSAQKGLVLTGSGDKTVKVWSLADYSCLRTFEGHSNSVLKVLWLPLPGSEDDVTGRSRHGTVLTASAGSDGLVKVWNVSSVDCVCTLDNHTDRVWALATHASTRNLASGGADGVVTFWADTTAETAAASAAASTARVEQEQLLLNHAHAGNYREAIVLALQLNHPARLLGLFRDVLKRHPPEPGSISGVAAVDDVLGSLADEQLFTLLLRLRDWNTNARTAPVAQRVLNVVVGKYPAARLVGLASSGRGRAKALQDLLDALRVYSERHLRRCEELIEESYLVDFVVGGMVGGDGADGAVGQMTNGIESIGGSELRQDMIMVD